MDNAFANANNDCKMLAEAIARHLADQGEEIEIDKLEGKVDEFIAGVLPKVAGVLVASHKRTLNRLLRDHRYSVNRFEGRLYKQWKKPFELLRLVLNVSMEMGGDFAQHHGVKAAAEKNHEFEALVKLHARGCLISGEVLQLMEGGYASGAMARWRALHETAVVASFIRTHGGDTAERYLHHAAIETRKAAHQQQKYHQRLGQSQIPQEELDRLDLIREKLCEKYSTHYDSDWGWAAAALGGKKPTFTMIEESAGLDHFRPYFKLACYSTHAGSKALWYDLGTSLVPRDSPVLLIGPSDAGMEEPGQCTALSLVQIFSLLILSQRPHWPGLQYVKAMDIIGREAMAAFIEAGESLAIEAELYRARQGLSLMGRVRVLLGLDK